MRQLRHILLVEDDADIRTIARFALERLGGFRVSAAWDADSALEVARAHPVDLALLDVMLPGLDGPSTLRALRELPGCASLPAILITAAVDTHRSGLTSTPGVLGIIAKPFDATTLSAQIAVLWGELAADS